MSNIDSWYDRAKKWPWAHFLVPPLLLVLADYLRLLLWFGQILVATFIVAQAALFVVGTFAAIMVMTSRREVEPWNEMLEYRLAKFFPTLKLGFHFFKWMMEKPEGSRGGATGETPHTD